MASQRRNVSEPKQEGARYKPSTKSCLIIGAALLIAYLAWRYDVIGLPDSEPTAVLYPIQPTQPVHPVTLIKEVDEVEYVEDYLWLDETERIRRSVEEASFPVRNYVRYSIATERLIRSGVVSGMFSLHSSHSLYGCSHLYGAKWSFLGTQ